VPDDITLHLQVHLRSHGLFPEKILTDFESGDAIETSSSRLGDSSILNEPNPTADRNGPENKDVTIPSNNEIVSDDAINVKKEFPHRLMTANGISFHFYFMLFLLILSLNGYCELTLKIM